MKPAPVWATAGHLLLFGALLAGQWHAPPPTTHAYSATVAVMTGYGLFHIGLAVIMLVFVCARARAGFLSATRQAEPRIARLWSDYAAGGGLIVALAIQLPPLLA